MKLSTQDVEYVAKLARLEFTDAQKAFILKQGADGHTVAEICRKAGISEAT